MRSDVRLTGALCLVLAALTLLGGCSDREWRRSDAPLRNGMIRIAAELAADLFLDEGGAALNEVVLTVAARPPLYNEMYGFYFWQGEAWVLEFGRAKTAGRLPWENPEDLPARSQVRAVGLQVRNPTGEFMRRVTLFPDRKESARTGMTSVTPYHGATGQITSRSQVREAVARIVEEESSGLPRGELVSLLTAAIRTRSGSADPEGGVFEWSAGPLKVTADCASVHMRTGNQRKRVYYINSVVIAQEGEQGERMRLHVTGDAWRLVEYQETALTRLRGGGG